MKIFIKTLKGTNFEIDVKPEDTVNDLFFFFIFPAPPTPSLWSANQWISLYFVWYFCFRPTIWCPLLLVRTKFWRFWRVVIGKDLFVGEVEFFFCCFAYFLWIIARFFNGSSLDYFRVLRAVNCFADLSIGLIV